MEAILRRVQRPAGLIVAGLTLLVSASALVFEVLDAGRGWAVACLAIVTAFVTLSAGWFAHASRGGNEDIGRLIRVVPTIWVLLLVFVVLPVAGTYS